ncbi:MAG: hypothetical protein AAF591_04115 [Verrucomicrobiota bacterium]
MRAVYKDVRKTAYAHDNGATFENPFYVRYEQPYTMTVVVHVLNGKIIKLGALREYQGAMPNGIRVGMVLVDAMEIEPRIYFDEFDEQLYIKQIPGITFERPDPRDRDSRIEAISVFLPDLKDNWDSEKGTGNW